MISFAEGMIFREPVLKAAVRVSVARSAFWGRLWKPRVCVSRLVWVFPGCTWFWVRAVAGQVCRCVGDMTPKQPDSRCGGCACFGVGMCYCVGAGFLLGAAMMLYVDS